MNRENMTHDDLLDELDGKDMEIKDLEFDLKEAQEEIKILNEMLDEIYNKAEKAEALNQEIVDMIP